MIKPKDRSESKIVNVPDSVEALRISIDIGPETNIYQQQQNYLDSIWGYLPSFNVYIQIFPTEATDSAFSVSTSP